MGDTGATFFRACVDVNGFLKFFHKEDTLRVVLQHIPHHILSANLECCATSIEHGHCVLVST